MPLTILDPNGRRQSRRSGRPWLWFGALAVLVGMLGFAYNLGGDIARADLELARRQVEELQGAVATAQAQSAAARSTAETAAIKEQEWQKRYSTEVPTGELKPLLDQMRAHLDAGVAPDRIALLLRAAGQPRSCDNAPVSRRFLVRTPISGRANDTASFGNNAITISAEGKPTVNAEGRPEAWFDPAQAVNIQVASLGGETWMHSAVLPIHASTVVQGSEYRFSVVAAETRGFVIVTADRCKLP
jgi:hypothetical protein